MRLYLFLKILLVFIFVSACSAAQNITNILESKKAVNNFYKELDNKNYEEAALMFDTPEPLLTKKYSEIISSCGGVDDVSFVYSEPVESELDKIKHSVYVRYKGDCKPENIVVVAHKVDDHWRLSTGKNTNIWSDHRFDSVKAVINREYPFLQNGDLIFQRGDSLISSVILHMKEGSVFSHVGIFFADNSGNEFVIESTPERNGVSITNLKLFLNYSKKNSVYRIKNILDIEADRVVLEAKKLLGAGFDSEMIISDDAKIYCTELVFKAIKNSGVSPVDDIEFVYIRVYREKILLPDSLAHWGRAQFMFDL